jgi:hypothetical protein
MCTRVEYEHALKRWALVVTSLLDIIPPHPVQLIEMIKPAASVQVRLAPMT